jgi:hypothetical protein
MYTIIIAIVIVAVVALFILGLVAIHNRQTGKMVAELLAQFGDAAQKENLKFSKKEILGNLIIGLDDVYNKLMILKRTGDEYHTLVIDLNEVNDCSKRKVYRRIDISMGKREKYENYVEEIVLSFDIPLQLKQEKISFYDSGVHGLRDLSEAEQKATEWETTIRKILLQIHQKRA